MWTAEKLLECQKKTVKVCGDDVVIRKLMTGEVLGKWNDEEKSLKLMSASLVDPPMSIDDVAKLPLDFTNALMPEITSFNGMDKEAKQGN